MHSNIILRDFEEQSIARDSRVSCNQIRTKLTSFSWIKKRWRRFRIARLNMKLEGMKDDLVTSSFHANSQGVLTKESDKKLTRKTNAIARVEEKIKILSKATVPPKYVSHRAIKLREKMMRLMTYNSSNAYSVGIENYDQVFAEETPVENPAVGFDAPQAAAVMAAAKPMIDVAQVSADQQAFASEVNKAMNSAEENPINRETIENIVDQSFEKVERPPVPTFNYFSTPAAQPAAVTPVVTTPPVRPVAESVPEAPVITSEAPISRDKIEEVVDQSFEKVERPPVPTFDYFSTPAAQPAAVTPVVTTPPVRPVAESVPEAPVITSEAPISRDKIEEVVDQSFEKVERPPVPTFDYFSTPAAQPAAVTPVVTTPPVRPVAESVPEAPVITSEAPISRDEIEEVVDKSFEKVVTPPKATFEHFSAPKVKPEVTPEPKKETISRDAIEDVVDKSFEEVVTPPKATFDYFSTPQVKEISAEEVQKTVGDKPSKPEIDYSALKDAMSAAVNGDKANESDSDFIEEMKKRKEKYNYVPMTDEEIIKAREHIEYDKYEKKYEEQWKAIKNVPDHNAVNDHTDDSEHSDAHEEKETPVRDSVVVAPERKQTAEEITKEDEPKKGNDERVFLPKQDEVHFDYSDATEKDVQRASSYESSKNGLEALKERLLKIKEEHKQSELELIAARDEQTDEARKAMEVREASRAKKHDYEESVKKLKDLCDSLEEETKVNISSAAISRNDTECNRRFIQMHTAEIHEYEDKIKEIDSIISQESDDIKRR